MSYLQTTTQSPAARAAESVLRRPAMLLQQILSAHRCGWAEVWENREATPQQILAALGTNGVKALTAGARSIAMIEAIAADNGTTAAALLGDAKYLTTKYPVAVAQDGTVTVVTQ